MQIILTLILTAIALLGTTAFHYETVRILGRRIEGRRERVRRNLPLVITGLVVAHLIEIGFYMAIMMVAVGPLGLGSFVSAQPLGPFDIFYFAAETYSSLGYGDIIPLGPVRLIAAIEPLNGLLLLAWSGTFVYMAVHAGTKS